MNIQFKNVNGERFLAPFAFMEGNITDFIQEELFVLWALEPSSTEWWSILLDCRAADFVNAETGAMHKVMLANTVIMVW